jgi:hypothetical protein
MQLDINMNQIVSKVQEEATQEATELMRRRLRQQFAAFFNNGQHWGSKKGMGYIMLEQMLDDIVSEADFEKMVSTRARSAYQAMLDEQIDYQLRRKAQKAAAKIVKEIVE